MKVAIVHDDIIQFGGAERLLLAMHEIWPTAPVYTLIASKKWKQRCKEQHIELRTSFLDKFPFAEKLNRYFAPFLLHILAVESFDLSEFDLVISSSSRYAHGVITKPSTTHVCYMNSPGRMFWEPKEYFERESFGFLKKIRFLAQPFLSLPLSFLRLWDYIAAQRVDLFIANSKTPAARIKKYYRKGSKIVYPFVEYEKLANLNPVIGDYYLVITRLSSWKKVEIAVRACNELKLNLKVVGEGPDFDYLKNIAGPTVELLGYVSEKRKTDLLLNCRALINTQAEDFGIVPLEAMACGKSVIAYKKGGVLETVIEGKTGQFFTEQTIESLKKALISFKPEIYDPQVCKKQALAFDKTKFVEDLKSVITQAFY